LGRLKIAGINFIFEWNLFELPLKEGQLLTPEIFVDVLSIQFAKVKKLFEMKRQKKLEIRKKEKREKE